VPLLLLVLVGDLLLANGRTNLARPVDVYGAISPPEIAALRTAVRDSGNGQQGLPGRVYNEYRLYEDYGMQAQIEDVWGSSPLRLARYEMLFQQFPLDRLWQLTGVSHVLTWRRELFVPSVLLAEFPQPGGATYLHRLLHPNPRAWVVPAIQFVDDAGAARLLADHNFDLNAYALLSPDQAATLGLLGQQTAVLRPAGLNTVQVERIDPHRLRVHVQSENGGLLVLSENWLPGWHALLKSENGEKQVVPVMRTNLTFLGIMVHAGASTIELVYWPASLRYGLIISGVTVAALLLWGLRSWWQRRLLQA